jgi:hypothetical protein
MTHVLRCIDILLSARCALAVLLTYSTLISGLAFAAEVGKEMNADVDAAWELCADYRLPPFTQACRVRMVPFEGKGHLPLIETSQAVQISSGVSGRIGHRYALLPDKSLVQLSTTSIDDRDVLAEIGNLLLHGSKSPTSPHSQIVIPDIQRHKDRLYSRKFVTRGNDLCLVFVMRPPLFGSVDICAGNKLISNLSLAKGARSISDARAASELVFAEVLRKDRTLRVWGGFVDVIEENGAWHYMIVQCIGKELPYGLAYVFLFPVNEADPQFLIAPLGPRVSVC